METATKIISFTLLIGLALSPVLIVWQLDKLTTSYKFIIYLVIGILTTAAITFTFGWWIDTSDQLLLKHYGYNFNAMNNTERFGNVAPENMARVKSLEISIMGIGWPVKVAMLYVFYSPYLLMVYLVAYLFKKTQGQ